MPYTVESILERLKNPKSDVLDLLDAHHTKEDQDVWTETPHVYRGFVRHLIDAGHPTRAIDLAREGLARHPHDAELQYLIALAFGRSGNIVQAKERTEALLKSGSLGPDLLAEALSLQGNYFKQRFTRTRDRKQRALYVKQSAECYERAFAVSPAFFPLINLATLSVLMGKLAQARKHAKGAIALAGAAAKREPGKRDYWTLATLAEAYLILSDTKKAKEWMFRALEIAGRDVGKIASTRKNLLLLKEKLDISEQVWGWLNVGRVVAFSGHMIDHPSRNISKHGSRFPPDRTLEKEVSRAIRDKLDDINATVGYCSAACGSDILFAERMLERDAELHIVLPFHKDDFYYTSVDFGIPEMAGWKARCDAVLHKVTPARIHYATTERFFGDEVLFDFVNTFTQGLAVTRAAERGVDAHALTVLDESLPSQYGGTAFFLETWAKQSRPYQKIDLEEMRGRVTITERQTGKAAGEPITVRRGNVSRQIKTMMFADVKGFSRLAEQHVGAFYCKFVDEVSAVMKNVAKGPEFANTWGDGLFLVFDQVTDAADFAHTLLRRFRSVDWSLNGASDPMALRIGFHAGPVGRCKDPIIRRNGYYGTHVNRAARIEPVTTPGCAFASEQAAAMLALRRDHDFVCEFVGVEELHKNHDRCPLYRLEKR